MKLNLEDLHIRIIDQRIGMGVGGCDTVMRIYHVPTGILIEVPSSFPTKRRGQYYVRQLALDMLEYALADSPDEVPLDTPVK